MNEFIRMLQVEKEEKNSILCFGMDPVIGRMIIDTSKNLTDEIVNYFSKILFEIKDKITAVKPNIGFYLQYGIEGMRALERLIKVSKSLKIPVIIDAKTGDIGKTAKVYAKYIFENLDGDAVTLNPYMGYDSLEPFFLYKSKGFYILALTSNKGAADFQMKSLKNGKVIYEHIIKSLCIWNKRNKSIGAVIGATQNRFGKCIKQIVDNENMIPLLIPGVGAQGGSYKKIIEILDFYKYNNGIVRINSSSSISYAHERFKNCTFEEASYMAVEEALKN